MSLTSILRDKDFQELRDRFKADFPKPRIYLKSEILALPRTKHYSIIGTAFDYLLRFYLKNKYPKAVTQEWVAEFDIESEIENNEIESFFYKGKKVFKKVFVSKIEKQLNWVKENYKKYTKYGVLTEDIIISTIFLAQLDIIFRAGIIDDKFGIYHPLDIKDLKQLIAIINHDDFKVKKKCYLNPTFGNGSLFIGGADADLILDGTLVDVKVTKYLKLTRGHLNQLLGYYILSLLDGVNGDKKDKPIKNLAVYFARYGKMWKVPITELGDKTKFNEFKDWFIKYINKNVWRGSCQLFKEGSGKKRGKTLT